jgi:hypothetical protein
MRVFRLVMNRLWMNVWYEKLSSIGDRMNMELGGRFTNSF